MLGRASSEAKREHPEVIEIIWYGSFTRRDFTPYSDIDIAVIVKNSGKRFVERQDDFVDYFRKVPLDVNLVVYTPDEIERMSQGGNRFAEEILSGLRLSGGAFLKDD
jgi:uncharacterized protein